MESSSYSCVPVYSASNLIINNETHHCRNHWQAVAHQTVHPQVPPERGRVPGEEEDEEDVDGHGK
jgi:hypothetical protein